MRKVFWDDPYQTTLKTSVSSISENKILLQETIIFSFSGGQESDRATINSHAILDSEIDGSLIYYTLAPGHGLVVGEEVLIEIDWPRRYKLMRLHFAAELILELITRHLGLEKIGAHIAEDKARIDFIFDRNLSFIFEDLLQDYRAIIARNEPIQKDFSDLKAQRRFWKIEGFAEVPCGGTHVRSTGEVGDIALKRKNIGGGKERVEITLLSPVLDQSRKIAFSDPPRCAAERNAD